MSLKKLEQAASFSPEIQLLFAIDIEGVVFYDIFKKNHNNYFAPGLDKALSRKLLFDLVRQGLIEKHSYPLSANESNQTTTLYRLAPKGYKLLGELGLRTCL